VATETLLTIEEFDALPIQEGVLYELTEGVLVTIPERLPRHNLARDNLARFLGDFVDERSLGLVFVGTGYQLGPDTVRIPDVSFLPAERLQAIDLDRRIRGAPALVVEVVSPTDLAQDLNQKVRQYLDAGAPSVWVCYPKAREVEVFRADGSRVVRHENEVLEEPEVLPGFSLEVKTIFA
jgi:Uma2 family endonuclease